MDLVLTGIGDPTGTGEGFSFMQNKRTRSETPSSKASISLGLQQKGHISGTESDLRKLTEVFFIILVNFFLTHKLFRLS
jgi:hypothetical protein